MNKDISPRRGLLSRLARDTAGNTLFMVGFSIIPLVGMIGAGVDVSRGYMVKSRLQAACDAGVLAGRKYATNANFDAAAQSKAQAFFKNNFPLRNGSTTIGAFGTTDISFTPTQNAEGEIVGTARARVPMTVMTVFGFNQTDFTVNCDARLDIGNVDVALVLDVTGSMSNSLGSGTRISALKESVINFYNILGPGDPDEGRIRYAIVPYSTNVNVGYSIPLQHMVGGTTNATWIYQTRVANMTNPRFSGSGTPVALTNEVYGASISAANCALFGQNASFSGFTGGPNPRVTAAGPPAVAITYSNNATAGADWGYSGAPDTSGTSRSCRRKRSQNTGTIIGYDMAGEFDANQRWTYRQAAVDVSQFVRGNEVKIYPPDYADDTSRAWIGEASGTGTNNMVPTSKEYDMLELVNTPGGTVTGGVMVKWNGCIEEADTVDTITATTPVNTVPAGAFDLDIDLVPDEDEEKWRPAWDDMIHWRTTAANNNAGEKEPTRCPVEPARRLMEYTSIDSAPTGFSSLSSFRNYVNSLTLSGGTMHDIGFVWGARFISGDGIFAADNPNSWNGEPVSRHIIFMTDGQMNAHDKQYTFHGWNDLDQRVAPRGTPKSTMHTIHNRRLRILCEQAKAKNITVWMVALADPDPAGYPDMRACASTEDHFKFVESADELNNEFRRIASNIAELRLTK
jgi:Flp pilus assembly protein TadG